MLRNIETITGYKLKAKDGELGKVKDLLFDDHSWKVRYIVVDTGSWLVENKILISPQVLSAPDYENSLLPVDLTKQQIEESPGLDSQKPVSRQHEAKLHEYYGWTPYWGAPIQTHGIGVAPPAAPPIEEPKPGAKKDETAEGDPNLRSTKELAGYDIHATDVRFGHVEDFVVDDETWDIRYMVVDTRDFLPGKKVLVSPDWITGVDWAKSEVSVNLDKEKIKGAPEFDPEKRVERDYEERLHDYYGKSKYWEK